MVLMYKVFNVKDKKTHFLPHKQHGSEDVFNFANV